MTIIDPWGSILIKDYERLMDEFGLEHFSPKSLPNPNRLMRRGIVFAARDFVQITKAIQRKNPYYVLSGIMPSAEKLHLGNKMVVENIRYFQDNGAKSYMLVADLEASATRGIGLEEARKRALEFHIPAYIALGLDPKKTLFYFQSENRKVLHMAYEFAKKITLSEFKAIYGSADPARIMSAVMQAGDILFPQLEERMPGVIPVGIDQDPHIRLTRDVVKRTKTKYKFFPPSGIYNKFTPSLSGDFKMSKSKPESCIELPEDPNVFKPKIYKALSGGRGTLEEHRKLGAIIEQDMCFELLKQHLIEDDNKLKKIHDDYKSGKMTTGEVKDLTFEEMKKFMEDFRKKLEKAKKQIDSLKFIRD